MQRLLILLFLIAPSFLYLGAASCIAQVHVDGYYRKNGTYVQPHWRSSPDGNFYNNYSTKGNINPFTGAEGTRVTPPGMTSGYGGYPGNGLLYAPGSNLSFPGYPSYPSSNFSGIEYGSIPNSSQPFQPAPSPFDKGQTSQDYSSNEVTNPFVSSVTERIKQSYKTYPASDVTARIYFEIDGKGDLENLRVLSASGNPDGLKNAIDAIRSATPFALPPGRGTERFAVNFKNGQIDTPSTFKSFRTPMMAPATPRPSLSQSPYAVPFTPYIRTPVAGYGRAYYGEGGGHWISENNSGKVIILEDNSVWKISPMDQIDCTLWLPITDITVARSSNPSFPYLLINTEDGETVEAELLSP